MQLAGPISVDGQSFEPQVQGQTALFPLEDELQRVMEATFQRAVQINRERPRDLPITGFIHDWARYEQDDDFRINAQRILSSFKSTLAPYIGGLELHELGGAPGLLGPALMRYEAQQGDVKYSLIFRISDKSMYLIASPTLECTLPESSVIRPTLTGIDSNQVYERILDYVFRHNELDGQQDRDITVKPWGYEFALKPVLVGDIPSAAAELYGAAREVEDQSEVVHQAASLLSFAIVGGREARNLEKKLADSPAVTFEHRILAEERIYQEARKLLDTVKIRETPTLDRYFV